MLSLILKQSGLSADRKWTKFLLRWMGFSLFLHLLAAWLSAGFYHADEHFQIVEFANYLLGKSPASQLPLEYSHQLRPWLFPAILAGMTKILTTLGVSSPFSWAFGYRCVSSLLGWL